MDRVPSPRRREGAERAKGSRTQRSRTTQGGVAVAVRSQLASAPWPIGREFPDDYACQTVRCHGIAVALVAMYLRPSIGLTGVNVVKLQRCGAMLTQLGVPTLVLADWNAEPSQLLDSGWPQRLGLVVLHLDVPTCSSGRCLGYGLVSRQFVAQVSAMAVLETAPWRPHVGLRIVVSLHPERDAGLVQKQPIGILDSFGPDPMEGA